jgi:hypothetical protein
VHRKWGGVRCLWAASATHPAPCFSVNILPSIENKIGPCSSTADLVHAKPLAICGGSLFLGFFFFGCSSWAAPLSSTRATPPPPPPIDFRLAGWVVDDIPTAGPGIVVTAAAWPPEADASSARI